MGDTRRTLVDVAALAGATLLLEGTLLRLLAIAQFYHFAFLVVSLALLGFGASGTLLSLTPRLRGMPLDRLLPWTGALFTLAVAVSYALVNRLPFDSYSIAWERRQILYFALYYLALTLPFMAGGLGIGAALAAGGSQSHRIYAANLLGSAVGALLAPAALTWAGVPGAVLAAGGVGLLPAWRRPLRWPVGMLLAGGLAGLVLFGVLNSQGRGPLSLTISPYKGLAYAQRYPGATRLFGAWNAISRVDVMANAGTRQLPGLSYAYPGDPPPQLGLALDAGALQPVTLAAPDALPAAAYLPEALAYELRPAADALLLEPGAGLGVLQALAGGAARVTAVVDNPLVRRAVNRAVNHTGAVDPFANARVRTVFATGRAFAQADRGVYTLVVLPLTDPYQPVTSGAYSLAETYHLTVEAMRAALARLAPDGTLVVTRWLQMPPSESLRLIGTLAAALEQTDAVPPADALVAYRGIQTITVLVQPDGWDAAELAAVREWTSSRRYDLVWAPDLRPDEVNRYNRLAEPVYSEATAELLTGDRAAFYRAYPFAVTPATDDHPFFHHYFRWGQTPAMLATLGRTWQPFGGSGYFLLLAMLALVLVLSAVLILAPLAALGRAARPAAATPAALLLYFACLGLAFLFVEIPLIQRWILLVGHPSYAFAAVVLILLVFSSLGSLLARSAWLRPMWALAAVTVLAAATPFAQAALIERTLGWPLPLRAGAAALALAPLAVCMGLPFPLGLAWLERAAPAWIPWAWAVNGCASVVAGVLAAILSLSYGFTAVLIVGAGCYAGAWWVFRSRYLGAPK